MTRFRKLIIAATLFTLIGTSIPRAHSAEYCSSVAGCGYEECRTSPCLTPAIALGTIALVAIIAVAVQNTHHGHCHAH